MKKKLIFSVSVMVMLAILIAALSGCSLARFAFKSMHRRAFAPYAAAIKEKQRQNEEFDFKGNGFSFCKKFNKELKFKEAKQVNGAFIGVLVSPGAEKGDGVRVEKVIAGSPAEKAGIKEDDYITSFEGKDITSPAALIKTVMGLEAGDVVTVTVKRDSESIELELTLGESLRILKAKGQGFCH